MTGVEDDADRLDSHSLEPQLKNNWILYTYNAFPYILLISCSLDLHDVANDNTGAASFPGSQVSLAVWETEN